jgi:hypothetical protein
VRGFYTAGERSGSFSTKSSNSAYELMSASTRKRPRPHGAAICNEGPQARIPHILTQQPEASIFAVS